jgi:xanthine dehydrogenase YagR molybdenum-binding subunit
MATAAWPPPEKRTHLGKRVERLDGPPKATGVAKYAYDLNRPGMLWARVLGSVYAKAKIVSVDTSAADALPGVKATWKDDAVIGNETGVNYVGQIIAAVAAETEEIAKCNTKSDRIRSWTTSRNYPRAILPAVPLARCPARLLI